MVRTVSVSGDHILVHADGVEVRAEMGPGRIVSATFVIEDGQSNGVAGMPLTYEQDPLGKELDDLLAMTDPVEHFVDDSREAIYTPDEELGGKKPE